MKPDFRETAMAALRYDPESGHFYWRERRGNKIAPDMRAGTLLQGYVMINLAARGLRVFRAHRLAWLFITGDFPPKGYEIDHINGDRADNRWANLRLVTRSQNNMNVGIKANNRSGCPGVSYQSRRGNWTARIRHNGSVICLGEFTDKQDAIRARKDAERTFYGEYAPARRRTAIPRGWDVPRKERGT